MSTGELDDAEDEDDDRLALSVGIVNDRRSKLLHEHVDVSLHWPFAAGTRSQCFCVKTGASRNA